MAKKEVMNEYIQPYTLDNKQIKERIESCIAYDEKKYEDVKILFAEEKEVFKLPFSDLKISIAQELEENKLLLNDFEKPELIPETVIHEEPVVEVDEDPKINVLDELYEFEDKKSPRYRSKIHDADTDAIIARIKAEAREKNKGKKVTTRRDINDEIQEVKEEEKRKKKERRRSRIKKVNTLAIIARIKREARAKNKGKKVITRRDINKELKPYLLKKNAGMNMDDDTLTSIDIYLNAVNRIETNNDEVNTNTTPLELNLKDILNDLDKK